MSSSSSEPEMLATTKRSQPLPPSRQSNESRRSNERKHRGFFRAPSAGAIQTRVKNTVDSAYMFARRRSSSAGNEANRTRTNHHITFQGIRSSEGVLSASGLPAVRMSTLSNIVLPSTFHFEPLEDYGTNEATAPSTSTTDVGQTTQKFQQAGGHSGSFRNYGPVLEKKVTEREAAFYESAERGEWPIQFLPRYYGRCLVDGEPGIRLENLTHGLSSPCVMDLKMGFQSVEDGEKSLFKRLRHTALDHLTGSKHSGVRLEGLSMYRTLEKKRMKGTKAQSHTVSANIGVSLQDVLTFFLTDESGVRTDVALRFQAHIEALLHYFSNFNDSHLFIGSSILLIYNNDNEAPHMRWARALQRLHTFGGPTLSPDRLATLTRRTKVDVRMIDFAHTGPLPANQNRDEGYIQGLHTVLTALKAIRAGRRRPIFSMADAATDVMIKKNSGSTSGDEDGSSELRSSEDGSNFNFSTLYDQCSAISTDSFR